jgi:hypothetical protein
MAKNFQTGSPKGKGKIGSQVGMPTISSFKNTGYQDFAQGRFGVLKPPDIKVGSKTK